MSPVQELTRQDARRIAVRAQLLDAPRPADLLEVVRHLTAVQHDPVAAIAPSADLVLWSRLGASYDPRERHDALETGSLVDLRGMIRPAGDIELFLAEMAQWPGPDAAGYFQAQAAWVEANEEGRRAVLDALRADGPLPVRQIPDRCVVPWRSSGWNNNKNLTMLLGLMVERGEVAVAAGTGRDRLWDLAERVYPQVEPVPLDEARRRRAERRLTALGIARPGSTRTSRSTRRRATGSTPSSSPSPSGSSSTSSGPGRTECEMTPRSDQPDQDDGSTA